MAQANDDHRFVAIGEIGLDFFVPALMQSPLREKQEFFYVEQLKIARDFGLPVLLHVRRSQDIILKHLRRIQVVGGIAHAFNGSVQQANHFIDLGFKLGFGGAMTYTRALQIRRLATDLPLEVIVLETDAPDIPPSWNSRGINSPVELPQIGRVLAELRGMSLPEIAEATTANTKAVLPRMSKVKSDAGGMPFFCYGCRLFAATSCFAFFGAAWLSDLACFVDLFRSSPPYL